MMLNLSSYISSHGSVVTIGSFDGLHMGHRAVLDALNRKAAEEGLPSMVVTFVEPPQNYLGKKKELIMPSLRKLKLLEEEVDLVIVANFMDLAKLSPGDFFEEILMKKLKASAIVVGENFRFGVDRSGDVKNLERMGKRHGIDVIAVPMVRDGGREVSSTRIRGLIKKGEPVGDLLKRAEPREDP